MKFGIAHGLRLAGIYKILNTASGKFYVGSSVNVESRIFKHLSFLRRSIHNNAHLQAAFTLYGEDAFEYSLIEACSPDQLLVREQHYLDTLQPSYNICRVAGNTLGVLHGPEAKRKMSAANMGNKRMLGKQHTPATKALLGALAAQRTHTPETKAKITAALQGNTYSVGRMLSKEQKVALAVHTQAQWDSGTRSREATAERTRAKWADPEWKAQQSAKIKAGKAARRNGQAAQLAN